MKVRIAPSARDNRSERVDTCSAPWNQDCSTSGAAASFIMMRPITKDASPNSITPISRYRTFRDRKIETPATPSTYNARNLMSKATTSIRDATPKFAPSTTRKPCRAEIRSDLSILTVIDVTATELCVIVPATIPQPNAAKRLLVNRPASIRIRGPATVFKLSDNSHIPKKSRPTPPMIPPNVSTIEVPTKLLGLVSLRLVAPYPPNPGGRSKDVADG